MTTTYLKKMSIGAVIIGVLIVLRLSGIGQYISLESLKEHRDILAHYVQVHALMSAAMYMCTYITVVALSLPVAAPLSMLGGFLFGVIPATLLTCVSATLGATLTFMLFRYLIGTALQVTYSQELASFNRDMQRYGSYYMLIVRCIPVIPFFLINILASWTTIPISTFMVTTAIGIIPGCLVYTYAGRQLGSINHVADIFSYKIALLFGLLVSLAVLSLLVKKYWLTDRP